MPYEMLDAASGAQHAAAAAAAAEWLLLLLCCVVSTPPRFPFGPHASAGGGGGRIAQFRSLSQTSPDEPSLLRPLTDRLAG